MLDKVALDDQKNHQLQQHYRPLVENCTDIVMRFDRTGRHLFVNQTVHIVSDLLPEDFIGKTHAELGYDPEDCKAWERYIKRVFDTGKSVETNFDFTVKGDLRHYDWRLMPEFSNSGEVVSVISFVRDVTEHREVEQNFHYIFEQMLNGFALHEIITDLKNNPIDYRYLSVNPAFEKMTGLNADDMIGKTVLELMPNTEQHWIDTYGKVALTGEPAQIERYAKEIGKYFRVAAFSPQKGQFAVLVEDVTDQRASRAEKERLESQLRQSQKMEAIGTLAGGIAHDFNNILSAILGFSELVRNEVQDKPNGLECINEVLRAGTRAKELVAQILDFSRQSEHRRRSVRIQNVVEEAGKLMRSMLPSTIDLRIIIDHHCPPVLADPSCIHQIVMNLATNAYHALREHAATPSEQGHTCVLEIRLSEENISETQAGTHPDLRAGQNVVLSVCDTGQGVEDSIRERIFDPYFTTKSKGEGTGLGLSTVLSIVKSHKGAIVVESALDVGTEFKVFFPVTYQTVSEAEAEAVEEKLPFGVERVLYVDDEEPILMVSKRSLERLGYRVTTKQDSVEALAIFKSKPDAFDLLITDLTMPNLTGMELAREVRQIKPTLPIILCSGFPETICDAELLSAGVAQFLEKPVSGCVLAQSIRDIFDA